MKMHKFYVGLIHFNEDFGIDLTKRLNELDPIYNSDKKLVKIEAEHIIIHEVDIDYNTKYHMIIDRGSHFLKHAAGVLMSFAFRGIYIVNNPFSFHYFISNKDVGFSIAYDLGLNIPTTYVLPSCLTPAFIKEDFVFHRHFNWDKMLAKVGFPCYIKPAQGHGAFNVNKAHNKSELLKYYNASGSKVMTVQSAVMGPFNWEVRCLCIGKIIKPIKYIFKKGDRSRYIVEENFLTPKQGKKIIDSARILNRIFGYEMNTIEFILDYEGNPWAIDFNNPVPDARKDILGKIFYEDYMSSMIKMVCDVARTRKKSLFIPPINKFCKIAQKKISRNKKFELALKVANQYYHN